MLGLAMKQQNPFEPTRNDSELSDGLVARMILAAFALLAFFAVSVAFLSQTYLILPLVFGAVLTWTAGFRIITCIASVILAYLLGYIGIEVCLEMTELGPAMTEETTGLYTRILVTTGLLFSFAAVLMVLLTRVVITCS